MFFSCISYQWLWPLGARKMFSFLSILRSVVYNNKILSQLWQWYPSQKQLQSFPGPMRSYTVNHIGSAVNEILQFTQTDTQRSCYFIIKISHVLDYFRVFYAVTLFIIVHHFIFYSVCVVDDFILVCFDYGERKSMKSLI